MEESVVISFKTKCERDGDSCRLVEEDDVPAFDFTDRYGEFLEDGEEYEVIVRKIDQKHQLFSLDIKE
ncbi:MAG: hypothetical protein JW802_07085 [Campylobacterales bacterium]|nr:hypothetical protein [Campylobacterales bacterium]